MSRYRSACWRYEVAAKPLAATIGRPGRAAYALSMSRRAPAAALVLLVFGGGEPVIRPSSLVEERHLRRLRQQVRGELQHTDVVA